MWDDLSTLYSCFKLHAVLFGPSSNTEKDDVFSNDAVQLNNYCNTGFAGNREWTQAGQFGFASWCQSQILRGRHWRTDHWDAQEKIPQSQGGCARYFRLASGRVGLMPARPHCSVCQLIHLSVRQSPCVCHFCPSVWQRDNAEPWRSRLRLLLWLLVLGLLWERWIEGNSSLWVRGLGLQTCSSPVWDFAPMPDT